MFRGRPVADPVAHRSFEIVLAAVNEAQQNAVLRADCSAELLARPVWASVHGIAVLSLQQPPQRFGMDATAEELGAQTLSVLLDL